MPKERDNFLRNNSRNERMGGEKGRELVAALNELEKLKREEARKDKKENFSPADREKINALHSKIAKLQSEL